MSHTCTTTLIVVSEERNRTTEWNVKWPGQYHSRILDRWAANAGRSEGATAVKAVPFLCAARRSLSFRSVHVASCSCLALQLECIVEFCSPSICRSHLRARAKAAKHRIYQSVLFNLRADRFRATSARRQCEQSATIVSQ